MLNRIDDFSSQRVPISRVLQGDHIEVRNGTCHAGTLRVFAHCNFHVGRGERVLVTGPNGTGKSTLMHLVSGFMDLQQGTLLLPDLKRVSALLTPFNFIPGSLKENVDYKSLVPETRSYFDELAQRFSLGEKLEQDPAILSEGEKRKAQVIMTLLKDADFYLFDEPLENVDSEGRDCVMNAILARAAGRALVVIMHNSDSYRALFERQFTFPIGLRNRGGISIANRSLAVHE